MGCGTSTSTAVVPIDCDELTKEDETGSKLGSRGDSAVSKVTADSGVGVESSLDPTLPGAMPRKIPPLTGGPGLLQGRGSPVERPRSSEILEQLLSQGIIPVGPPREGGSATGEAYDITLDDGELPRQRPPARLEALKISPSRGSINHQTQQAEGRHQPNEEDLETRLRTKSARVRAPPAVLADFEDPDPPEDKPLHTAVTTISPDPQAHTQVREASEGSVRGPREGPGEGREEGREEEEGEEDEDEGRGSRGRDEEGTGVTEGGMLRGCGDREVGDGGPVQREGLLVGQLHTASGDFESDPSFQNTDETF